LAPGQNPHVNFEPSIHNGLQESAVEQPNSQPELHGRLSRSVLERRNDYVQARGRYCTMMDWERDDLLFDMGDLLGQCERDVQERMVWHFFIIHDDYGRRVAEKPGMTVENVKKLGPLPKQVLTNEDQRRLQNLGNNGDVIDPTVWGQWTSSVKNYKASAEEVLKGTLPAQRKARGEAAEFDG
jgi:catalase